MKILYIFFPLCPFISIANSLGNNSSYQKSKIVHGNLLKRKQYQYIASLQLDGNHICNSGLFKKGFLLTTGGCAWYIKFGMEKELQKATAVIGNKKLENGQRIDILKCGHHPRFAFNDLSILNNYLDFGVIKLADNADYTKLLPSPLYASNLDLRHRRHPPLVCGWKITNKDRAEENEIENAKNSDDLLKCMRVKILSRKICTPAIPPGDYKLNLMCGQEETKQNICVGDLGSPLTTVIRVNGNDMNHIVGITLNPFESKQGTYFRFIRSARIYRNIEQLVERLGDQTTEEADYVSDGEQDSMNKPYKRKKDE